jgi:hypothetical protein
MKYVVILSNEIETPIIFPETEKHIDHVQLHQKIISAGFCRFGVNADNTLGISCWGQSVGLGAKSRYKEDEDLIIRHNKFSA